MSDKKTTHGQLKKSIGSFEDTLDNVPHELKDTKQNVQGPDAPDFKGMRDSVRSMHKDLKSLVEKAVKESAPKKVLVKSEEKPGEFAGSQPVTTGKFASKEEVTAKHESDVE